MVRKIHIKPIWVIIGTAGFLGATMYPTFIDPYLYPEKWKKKQEEGRSTMDANRLYPYDSTMNRWKSPWDSEKKPAAK